MLPTTFGSDGILEEDRQKIVERTCFHPLPGQKSTNSPHKDEDEATSDKNDESMNNNNNAACNRKQDEPRFIPAPKALVQALLGKKTHQSRCVLVACSYCGRWTTERFYTKEEARLELLSESSAVHSIQNLACNSAFGQELLSAANLHKVLLSNNHHHSDIIGNNNSGGGKTSSSTKPSSSSKASPPPPLIEELLRRRSHIHISPSSDYVPPSMLTPTLKRYLEGHLKDVMEVRTLLEANGLALPADTQEGFLLDNYFYDKGIDLSTSNKNIGEETTSQNPIVKKEEKVSATPSSVVDPRIRFNHHTKGMEQPTITHASLTPSQKLRLAIHPELAADFGGDDHEESESASPTKKRSGGGSKQPSSSDAFDYAKKGLTLFIRNPSTFECNWQDCQEERMGLRSPSFRPEKRDPLSVHTWPTVNACLCARCGKLRLSSRFYPGCPMSFTCHLAAVPSERDCDVPESPLLAGSGSAVMAAPTAAMSSTDSPTAVVGSRRRGGRGGGTAIVAPLTLQEPPGRVKCGQYVSEEDPLVESQQLHDQARAAFEAHAEKLRIEKALADELDAEMATTSTRVTKRRGKKKDAANTSAAAMTTGMDGGINLVTDDDDDLLLLNVQNGSATSLMSDVARVGGGGHGVGGSPVSTAPMVASTRTLQSASTDSLLPTINPLAPTTTTTKAGKAVKGGKRGRQGGADDELAAASAELLNMDSSSSAFIVKESWVACDNCKKWRIVSRDVMQHVEETGDNWYCWENKPPRRCSEAEDEAK